MGRIEEKISSLERNDRNYEKEREVIRTKQFESDSRLSNLISHMSDLKRYIEEQGRDISKLKEEIAEIKGVIEPFKNIKSIRNFLYFALVILIVVVISSFFVSDQVTNSLIGLFQVFFR